MDVKRKCKDEIRKMKEVKFEVLMFLTSDGKIAMYQEDLDKDIFIKPVGVK